MGQQLNGETISYLLKLEFKPSCECTGDADTILLIANDTDTCARLSSVETTLTEL